MNSRISVWRHVVLICGLLLIALNLRPALTGIGPLAERMQAEGVSVEAIGMQTTIPLVLFGVAGFFVGAIGNRIGFARALGAGLLILSAGCFLRSWGFSDTGFERIAGSVLIGAGIAFGNVLLPGVVKSRYPDRVGLMTSLYSTAINLGAALGIAFAVPLAESLDGGWSASLRAWGYLALVPLLIWIPEMLREPAARSPGNPFRKMQQLARDARAWQVTGQMGLQSLLFYSSVAWLPTVLQVRGMSEAESYGWPAAMQVSGCLASLVVPTLAGRARSQSPWALACGLATVASFCGILWLPLPGAGVATIALGFSLNAGFGVSLLLIALRSRTAETAGSLSSMAQAFGYFVAAPFPWLIGWLSEATGSWIIAYSFLLLPALGVAWVGRYAGRPGFAG